MILRASLPALVVLSVVTLASEGRDSQTVSPSRPSIPSNVASPAASAGSTTLAQRHGGGGQTIKMFDACDPETFNAALGAGTCSRNGGVRFDKFLELLKRHQSVG